MFIHVDCLHLPIAVRKIIVLHVLQSIAIVHLFQEELKEAYQIHTPSSTLTKKYRAPYSCIVNAVYAGLCDTSSSGLNQIPISTFASSELPDA